MSNEKPGGNENEKPGKGDKTDGDNTGGQTDHGNDGKTDEKTKDDNKSIDKEIGNGKETVDKDKEAKLPKTATDSYNMLVGGLALVTAGILGWFYYRKKFDHPLKL